jgi:hypothetical protein
MLVSLLARRTEDIVNVSLWPFLTKSHLLHLFTIYLFQRSDSGLHTRFQQQRDFHSSKYNASKEAKNIANKQQKL